MLFLIQSTLKKYILGQNCKVTP